MRLPRKRDGDCLPGHYGASPDHDCHDTSFAYELSSRTSAKHGCHEPWLKRIQLPARIAETSQSHTGTCVEPKFGARGKAKKIDTLGCDILADLPGKDGHSGSAQLSKQLTVKQMDLAKVGLRRIASDARTMLYRRPTVCIAVRTNTLYERDIRHCGLGKRVRSTLVNCVDDGRHV